MSFNRWKLVAMPVLMMGLSSPLLVNCSSVPTGLVPDQVKDVADAAGGCDEMASGDFASLEMKGDAKASAKVRGFLEAAFSLKKVSAEMEADLVASCTALGKGLGATDEELKGESAEKVCGSVKAKLDVAI